VHCTSRPRGRPVSSAANDPRPWFAAELQSLE